MITPLGCAVNIESQSSGRELSVLLLPPGFCAQSQAAASAGPSAAAPVSGSPAGRSLFRVPGRQLVPKRQYKNGKSDLPC